MSTPRLPRNPGEQLLIELTEELRQHPDVDEGTMLHSLGVRVGGTFFAFIGGNDRLIVKLPRPDGQALIASGTAEPVVLGKRTLKEWVSLAYPETDDADPDDEDADPSDAVSAWKDAIVAAHTYVSSLAKRAT